MRANEYFRKCIAKFGISDKTALFNDFIGYMLMRTQSMFEYKNLPDTIPANILELMLQQEGFAVITDKYDGNLYAYASGVGLGGQLDEYYRPTQAVIANPYQEFNATLDIGKDCEVILNDSLYMGLMPLFERYAELLTENTVSMRAASINSRILALMASSNDRTKTGFDKLIKDIYNGELASMLDDDLISGIHVHPVSENSHARLFTELVEYDQYLKGSWYGDIGVEAAYNMKRERLTEAESGINTDSTVPLAVELLNSRRRGLERVNEHYGTDIQVDFASVWRGLDEISAISKPLENSDETNEESEGNNNE